MPSHRHLPCAALAASLFLLPVSAQELIAIDFLGNAFGVDLATAQPRALGPTGLVGCNAMAKVGSGIFTTSTVASQSSLCSLNPVTAQGLVRFPLGVDVRGLANGNNPGELFGIVNGSPDRLVRISTLTGVVTNVGNTGFTGLQALENDGQLWAWDVNAGLVRLDAVTGVGVDVDPNLGAQGVQLQFLTQNANDELIGGNSGLFTVSRQTGVVTPIGSPGSLGDLRGAELHTGLATLFGVPCATATGIASNLTADGSLLAGTPVNCVSANHAANAIGLLLIGLSKTVTGGVPLPISLDPVLGTSGCSLFVSPDLTIVELSNALGRFDMPFALPPVPGGVLHLQLATLESVPGGMSFSNGVSVQMPL